MFENEISPFCELRWLVNPSYMVVFDKRVLRVLSLNVFTVVFLSVYLVKKGPTRAQEVERDV